MKQVLSALRAIAGNDDVKDAIVHAGGTQSIVAAMTRHMASPQVLTPGAHEVGQGPRVPHKYLHQPYDASHFLKRGLGSRGQSRAGRARGGVSVAAGRE